MAVLLDNLVEPSLNTHASHEGRDCKPRFATALTMWAQVKR